jgi:hypothetical protein
VTNGFRQEAESSAREFGPPLRSPRRAEEWSWAMLPNSVLREITRYGTHKLFDIRRECCFNSLLSHLSGSLVLFSTLGELLAMDVQASRCRSGKAFSFLFLVSPF